VVHRVTADLNEPAGRTTASLLGGQGPVGRPDLGASRPQGAQLLEHVVTDTRRKRAKEMVERAEELQSRPTQFLTRRLAASVPAVNVFVVCRRFVKLPRPRNTVDLQGKNGGQAVRLQ